MRDSERKREELNNLLERERSAFSVLGYARTFPINPIIMNEY